MDTIALSTHGLVGAGIGLFLALMVNVVMQPAIKRSLEEPDIAADERARRERSSMWVRRILLADFVIMAGIGYYAGAVIGPDFFP